MKLSLKRQNLILSLRNKAYEYINNLKESNLDDLAKKLKDSLPFNLAEFIEEEIHKHIAKGIPEDTAFYAVVANVIQNWTECFSSIRENNQELIFSETSKESSIKDFYELIDSYDSELELSDSQLSDLQALTNIYFDEFKSVWDEIKSKFSTTTEYVKKIENAKKEINMAGPDIIIPDKHIKLKDKILKALFDKEFSNLEVDPKVTISEKTPDVEILSWGYGPYIWLTNRLGNIENANDTPYEICNHLTGFYENENYEKETDLIKSYNSLKAANGNLNFVRAYIVDAISAGNSRVVSFERVSEYTANIRSLGCLRESFLSFLKVSKKDINDKIAANILNSKQEKFAKKALQVLTRAIAREERRIKYFGASTIDKLGKFFSIDVSDEPIIDTVLAQAKNNHNDATTSKIIKILSGFIEKGQHEEFIKSFVQTLNACDSLFNKIKTPNQANITQREKQHKIDEISNGYLEFIGSLSKEQIKSLEPVLFKIKKDIGFEIRRLKYFSSHKTLEAIADYFNVSKVQLTLEKLLQDTEKLKTPIVKAFRKFVIDGKRDTFKEFDEIPTSENILGVAGEKEAQKIIQAYGDKLFVTFLELNQLAQQEFYDSNKIKILEDRIAQVVELIDNFEQFIGQPDIILIDIPSNLLSLIQAHKILAGKIHEQIFESGLTATYNKSISSLFEQVKTNKRKKEWIAKNNLIEPNKFIDTFYLMSNINPSVFSKFNQFFTQYENAYRHYFSKTKDETSLVRAEVELFAAFRKLNININSWLRDKRPNKSASKDGFSYLTEHECETFADNLKENLNELVANTYTELNSEKLVALKLEPPNTNGNCSMFYMDYKRNWGSGSLLLLDKNGNEINPLTIKTAEPVTNLNLQGEEVLKQLSSDKRVQNLVSYLAHQGDTAQIVTGIANIYTVGGRNSKFISGTSEAYRAIVQVFDERIVVEKFFHTVFKEEAVNPTLFVSTKYEIYLNSPEKKVDVSLKLATTKVNGGLIPKLNPLKVNVAKAAAYPDEYDIFQPYDQLFAKYLNIEKILINKLGNNSMLPYGTLDWLDILNNEYTNEQERIKFYLEQFYLGNSQGNKTAQQIITVAKEALAKISSDNSIERQRFLALAQFGYSALLECTTIALASKDPLISDIRCSLNTYLNAKEFIKKPIAEYEIIKQVTKGKEKEIKIPQYALKRCDHLLEINRKALMAVADNKYYEYKDKLEQLPSDYLFLLAWTNENFAVKIFRNKKAANKLKLEDIETLYDLYKDKVPCPLDSEIKHIPTKFIELLKTVNAPEADQQSSNLLRDVNNLLIKYKVEEPLHLFFIYGAKLVNKLEKNQSQKFEIARFEQVLKDAVYNGKVSLLKALELVSDNKRLCYQLIDKALDAGKYAFEISQLLNKDSKISGKAKNAFFNAFEKSHNIDQNRKPNATELLAKKIFNTKEITKLMGAKQIAYLMSEAPNTIEAAFQIGFFDWIWQGIGKLFGKNVGKINIKDKLISPNKNKTSENIKAFINEIRDHKDLAIQHILHKPVFYETNYVKLLNPNDLAEIILSMSQENLLDFLKNKDIISQLFIKDAKNSLLVNSANKEKLLIEKLTFLQAMGMKLTQAIEYTDGNLKEAFKLIDKLEKQQQVNIAINPQVVKKLQQIADHNPLIENLLIGKKVLKDIAQDISKFENIHDELNKITEYVLNQSSNVVEQKTDVDQQKTGSQLTVLVPDKNLTFKPEL